MSTYDIIETAKTFDQIARESELSREELAIELAELVESGDARQHMTTDGIMWEAV